MCRIACPHALGTLSAVPSYTPPHCSIGVRVAPCWKFMHISVYSANVRRSRLPCSLCCVWQSYISTPEQYSTKWSRSYTVNVNRHIRTHIPVNWHRTLKGWCKCEHHSCIKMMQLTGRVSSASLNRADFTTTQLATKGLLPKDFRTPNFT
jgi:hypothetical protein